MPILMTFLIGFPCKALEFAGTHPVREVPHAAKHFVHVRHDVLPVHHQRACVWRHGAGSRSAVCSTARFSDTLMCSPRNIASRLAGTPDSSASSTSSAMVSSVTRFFE